MLVMRRIVVLDCGDRRIVAVHLGVLGHHRRQVLLARAEQLVLKLAQHVLHADLQPRRAPLAVQAGLET